ncbi:MAG: glycosyltransferase [Oscillospiraceae bacterium]|nr:glycosyltransferase [Oscillospiraceae bacterium]
MEKYIHDDRVTVFHQQNRGLSAARNIGIQFSKGEYLCFVDSDDELLDGALEVLVRTAIQEKVKIVVSSFEKCSRDGRVQYRKIYKDEKSGIKSLSGFAHGKVIHYSIFNNLRFPEGYWYEDSIMAQIVHPMCKDDIYTISDICYKYYSNEAGISAISSRNKKSLDSLWITMRLLDERKLFELPYNQNSYEYFLSMVNLTYQRTKHLGANAAKCIFAVQKVLMENYYKDYNVVLDHKKKRIQEALKSNSFRKYILALSMYNVFNKLQLVHMNRQDNDIFL